MKKILFAFAFIMTTISCSTYNELILVVIESDYETFNKIYPDISISQKQHANLLNQAEQICESRQRWVTERAFQPIIGNELFKSIAWGFGAYFGLMAFVGGTGIAAEENQPGKAATLFLIGLGAVTYSVHRCIKNYKAAKEKPKLLLANALQIKDQLLIS